MSNEFLSHLDQAGRPAMVDISAKTAGSREAIAQARVNFSAEAWGRLAAGGFSTSKGPVFDVARIAGTMAVKQTSDLIPFCHFLPIEGCVLEISPVEGDPAVLIICRVRCNGKTGVEMEALTGASVAALTLYDMTKSLGPETVITEVKLVSKTGGKSDYVTT
ncbi:MAG: cyclic pyranopterin monophosphate synthase MoaC [Limisphaerales bacterium]